MNKDKSTWRHDTSNPHPLFEGNRALYLADQRWRANVPRTCNDGVSLTIAARAEKAALNWMQRRPR